MSWYGICVFREPLAHKDPSKHDPNDETTWQQGWEELLDSLDQTSAFLQKKADPALVAIEINDEGDPTGVVLRYRPEEVQWLKDLRDPKGDRDAGRILRPSSE